VAPGTLPTRRPTTTPSPPPPSCAHAYKPSAIKRALECGEGGRGFWECGVAYRAACVVGSRHSCCLGAPPVELTAPSPNGPDPRKTPAAPPNPGVRSIEHGNWLDAECAALMQERGAFLVPTTVTYDALR
jgi:hypothetical protein